MTKPSPFKPLGLEEFGICRRVALIRKFKSLNQGELSRRIGLTRHQLANIESARVSLKAATALEICRVLDVNPKWLRDGTGEHWPMLKFDDPLYLAILHVSPSSERFSKIWDDVWKNLPSRPVMGRPIIGGTKQEKKKSKDFLDKSRARTDYSRVQNEFRNLKELVAHLRRTTEPRGAKAALAREFGVTRQAVNQWLSGESAPSADIAIRLQHWRPKPAK